MEYKRIIFLTFYTLIWLISIISCLFCIFSDPGLLPNLSYNMKASVSLNFQVNYHNK